MERKAVAERGAKALRRKRHLGPRTQPQRAALRPAAASSARSDPGAGSSKETSGQPCNWSVGDLVWAQLGSARRWPAVVVEASVCGQWPVAPDCLWVCWLAEHRISQVHREKMWNFVLAFQSSLSQLGGKRYLAAVHEGIEEVAARSCTSPGADPLGWAKATFLTDNTDMAAHTAGPVPMAVQAALGRKEVPAVPPSAPQEEAVRETGALEAVRKQRRRRLEEVCVACDVVLPTGEEHQQHPLVEGGICADCREELLDTMFACSADGTSAYCMLCGSGDDLFICDNTSCSRCVCSHCLRRLIGQNEPEKVSRCSPWQCYLCSGHSAGQLHPRPDWEARVVDFFRPQHQWAGPAPNPMIPGQRQEIRVLSLFDGIATGKYVLDQLGISVEVYFASEVDVDAIHVGITQHGTSVTHVGHVQALDTAQLERLGPIDLLIGGSPCNDISLVNPDRKGFYDPTGTGILFFEFYRVLRTLQLTNGSRYLFWMFENVAAMPREYRRTISRFLQSEPALLDGRFFSPQARARLFWGNIPGMYAPLDPDQLQQSASLDSILDPLLNRKATVKKIRTVTTNPNSLRPTKNGVLPVVMDGQADVLWTTELEEVFGFPRHYTDVGNISLGKRRQLLGKAWSVPVVRHILRPLRSFFKLTDRPDNH